MKNIYLIGAGGHCKSCIDVIESTQQFKIKGLFDLPSEKGRKIGPYEILGTDDDIQKYVSAENWFLITLGQIKTAEIRKRTADLLKQLDAQVATVVSKRAYVSSTAVIGTGTIVMHDALVNSYARVGQHCIVNTKSLIEHDANVSDFCHISTGAIVNGNVSIGKESFIGSLSVIKEGLNIPAQSILGAGTFHRKIESST